jgi:hypothetical protein
MVAIKAEIWFHSLGTEPRFVELTRRVGLAQ